MPRTGAGNAGIARKQHPGGGPSQSGIGSPLAKLLLGWFDEGSPDDSATIEGIGQFPAAAVFQKIEHQLPKRWCVHGPPGCPRVEVRDGTSAKQLIIWVSVVGPLLGQAGESRSAPVPIDVELELGQERYHGFLERWPVNAEIELDVQPSQPPWCEIEVYIAVQDCDHPLPQTSGMVDLIVACGAGRTVRRDDKDHHVTGGDHTSYRRPPLILGRQAEIRVNRRVIGAVVDGGIASRLQRVCEARAKGGILPAI